MNIANRYCSTSSGSPSISSLVHLFLRMPGDKLIKKNARENSSSLNLQQFRIYVVNIDGFYLFTKIM